MPMTRVLTEFPFYLIMNLEGKTACPLCVDPSRLVVAVLFLSASYIFVHFTVISYGLDLVHLS